MPGVRQPHAVHGVLLEDYVSGAMSAGINKKELPLPFNGRVTGVFVRSETNGTKPGDATTNVVVDVNVGGTSILNTVFTNAGTGFTGGTLAAARSFVQGDRLSYDVDTVFNGTAPAQPTRFSIIVTVGV